MNMNPITRSELQELESKAKRLALLHIIDPSYQYVKRSASAGKTNVFIQTVEYAKGAQPARSASERDIVLYSYDLQGCLEILKELFPDSKVELQETWVDVNPTSRVLKKGILIDWS